MAQILLVENDDALRRFLIRELSCAGHQVTDFADGDLALAGFQPGRFALLLTDTNLPGLDGIALAREVAAADPDLKIVFITGFAALVLQPSEDAPEGGPEKNMGLSKPFHLREITGKIERLLAA